MFQILKTNGEKLGFVDDVHYIKIGTSGDYVQSGVDEAIGIALKGEPYKLDEVIIKEVDSGDINNQLNERNKCLRADVDYLAMETGVTLDV